MKLPPRKKTAAAGKAGRPVKLKSSGDAGLAGYTPFLAAVKNRIRAAQLKATLSANTELIHLYWDIGSAIAAMQEKEGWGAGVIPRLALDISNAMPEVKGFSERNLDRMVRFAAEYPNLRAISPTALAKLHAPEKTPRFAEKSVAGSISPTALAKLPQDDCTRILELVVQLPWAHNVLLIQKVKSLRHRIWYARQAITHGWSHNILALQIKGDACEQDKAIHNFHATLPPPQSDLAEQVLKDPYIFDFLTLAKPFRERELEIGLLEQIEKFLLELGQGFAFVGRQFHLDAGRNDFYLDLLFYHLRLRCFVVVDLKRGPFKPEYAGKMNFYCNIVDDRLRHPDDQPTVGLILCQDKDRIVAEYALKGVAKAIGVSSYILTRALPRKLRSSLPTVEQMETELARLTMPKSRKGKNERRPSERSGRSLSK